MTPPRPPVALVVLSGIVLLAGGVLMLVGACRAGISWDEATHVLRLRHYLDDGHFGVEGQTAAMAARDRFTYAPMAMLVLHGFAAAIGADGWSQVLDTPSAYAARHVAVALLGLVGVGAVVALCRRLLGCWQWGLVAGAALTAIPLWTGQAMFNIKDIPVGTGATLVTLGLVLTATPPRRRRPRLVPPLVVIAGALLALGTRPGMWPLVIAQVVALLVLLAAGRVLRTAQVIEVVAAALATYLVLALVYPWVFAHPLLALRRSVGSATRFRAHPPGRGYVAEHLVIELPTLLLLAAITGLVGALVLLTRSRLRPDLRVTALSLVGLQALLMPAVAVAARADLYNGLRQLIFITPALAVFAAVGLAWLLGDAGRVRRATVAGLAAVGLAVPVVTEASLFPTSYVYASPLADAAGWSDSSDYWLISARQFVATAPTDAALLCSNRVSVLATGGGADCRTTMRNSVGTFWRAARRPATLSAEGRFYALVDTEHPVAPNCRVLDERARHRLLVRVVLLRLLSCRRR